MSVIIIAVKYLEAVDMKLTYLGTAAAEGFPAVFCNCKYCTEARKLKGKNIRTRSQGLINDDMLIDFPADTYHHMLENCIEGDKIKYLIITHSHQDHFYFEDFNMRHGAYAHDMRAEVLEVYCGQGTYDKMMKMGVPENISVTLVEPFKSVRIGDYTVTPLPARHYAGDGALIYLVSDGEKTVLYAHDTGYFFDEVITYLKDNKIKLDMISLDCTNIDIPIPDNGSHMGLENIGRLTSVLVENGNILPETIKYINHFSHNANPIHHILEKRVASMGFEVSFDGCAVTV